jgi:tetratricopeptide (TPR) repeat protein
MKPTTPYTLVRHITFGLGMLAMIGLITASSAAEEMMVIALDKPVLRSAAPETKEQSAVFVMEKRLAEKTAECTSLSKSVEALKVELRRVREERRDFSDQLERREREWNLARISLEQRIGTLDKEKSEMASRLRDADKKLSGLAARVKEQESQLSDLATSHERALADLRVELEKTQQSVVNRDTEIVHLNDQAAVLNGVMAVLRSESDAMARETAQLKRRYQAAVRDHAAAEVEWQAAARTMDQRLARLHADQERWQQWIDDETILRRGGALRENMDNEWNAALVGSLNDVGLLMMKDGRLDQAEAFFKRALTILDQTSGRTRASSGTLLQHLADVAWMNGDLVAAHHYYAEAEQVFAKTVGPKHRRYAALLNGWAGVLQRQHKLTEAEETYRKAIAIYEQKRDGDPAGLAVVLHNVGLLLMDQGRLSEAGPLLEKSVALLTGDAVGNPTRAMLAVRSLARCHQMAGHMEQAAACELQANELAMKMMME